MLDDNQKWTKKPEIITFKLWIKKGHNKQSTAFKTAAWETRIDTEMWIDVHIFVSKHKSSTEQET